MNGGGLLIMHGQVAKALRSSAVSSVDFFIAMETKYANKEKKKEKKVKDDAETGQAPATYMTRRQRNERYIA